MKRENVIPLIINTLKKNQQHRSITFLPSDITGSLVSMNCLPCLSLQIPDEFLLKRQWPNICVLAPSSDKPAADW